MSIESTRDGTFVTEAPWAEGLVREHRISVDDGAEHLEVVKDSIRRSVEGGCFHGHKDCKLLNFRLAEVNDWFGEDGAGDHASEKEL